MKQATLKIDGMRCPMCESHVKDAVRSALPSAKKLKASHRRGEVSFLVEEETDIAPAIKKIEAGGYRVLSSSVGEPKGLFSFRK